MDSSSSEDFALFEALCSQPDLLELVVQRCSGNKNKLRLACSRLRAAVDACVTGLAWMAFDVCDPNEAKDMAVSARCPRLQTLDFNGCSVADSSSLASCTGLRRITGLRATWSRYGGNLAPFAALTQLEHLDCSKSAGISDVSALAACTALKYLDCSWTGVRELPPLPASLETLICHCTPLTNISALVACTALKHLDCSGCDLKVIPPLLPASLETLDISAIMGALWRVNLSPLAACPGLRSLDCSSNPVKSLAPLAACAGLCSLNCSGTQTSGICCPCWRARGWRSWSAANLTASTIRSASFTKRARSLTSVSKIPMTTARRTTKTALMMTGMRMRGARTMEGGYDGDS